MRIQCYHSWGDQETLDRLFQLAVRNNGWIKTFPAGMEIYVPEDVACLVLLIDPLVTRRSTLDWLT